MLDKGHLTNTLEKLKAGLLKIYGNRFKGLYLYGSYARGEQRQGSDIDVVVVLDEFQDRYGAEVDRTSELTAQLSLACGVSISKVFLSEKEWKDGESPFLYNVREDSIAA